MAAVVSVLSTFFFSSLHRLRLSILLLDYIKICCIVFNTTTCCHILLKTAKKLLQYFSSAVYCIEVFSAIYCYIPLPLKTAKLSNWCLSILSHCYFIVIYGHTPLKTPKTAKSELPNRCLNNLLHCRFFGYLCHCDKKCN